MRCLLDGVDFEDDLGFTAPRGDGERQGCEFEGVEERMNCEGQGQGQDNDGIGSVCEGIEEMMNCEGQGEQGHGGDGECQENEMDRGVRGQNVNTENYNSENFENENAQSEHLKSEHVNFENLQSEHVNSEHVRLDKGKRKISYAENQSSSEFDDSSDEDYLQSNEASTDSETPSLVLEDLEVSSDEDIFLNKNPSKRDLMQRVERETLRDWCIRGFDIEYVKNEKVRVTAKCKIEGVTEDSCIPRSKLILKKLEGSNPPIFDKMYVCLSALKNGFLSGCRPIIGLDGCFLKTCYGGQLLVAVGRDGNDNMFPLPWLWFK
ncbi:UNVERIFIED_CONTAM: hypothetical protein Scaly_1170700 [Sesamum calycinum]|uniref:Uncharacterized protein n=1 Tax=Sesamum calycinum TaxID=2727403 RepID=A0AAW2Q365_9LAMI